MISCYEVKTVRQLASKVPCGISNHHWRYRAKFLEAIRLYLMHKHTLIKREARGPTELTVARRRPLISTKVEKCSLMNVFQIVSPANWNGQ